jgi:hypothetical protein
LSGARKIVVDAALPGGRDLHIWCTGFTKQGFKVSGFRNFKDSDRPAFDTPCSGQDLNTTW